MLSILMLLTLAFPQDAPYFDETNKVDFEVCDGGPPLFTDWPSFSGGGVCVDPCPTWGYAVVTACFDDYTAMSGRSLYVDLERWRQDAKIKIDFWASRLRRTLPETCVDLARNAAYTEADQRYERTIFVYGQCTDDMFPPDDDPGQQKTSGCSGIRFSNWPRVNGLANNCADPCTETPFGPVITTCFDKVSSVSAFREARATWEAQAYANIEIWKNDLIERYDGLEASNCIGTAVAAARALTASKALNTTLFYNDCTLGTPPDEDEIDGGH